MEIIANLAMQNQQEIAQQTEEICKPRQKILKKRLMLIILLIWFVCITAQCTLLIFEKLDEETLSRIIEAFVLNSKSNQTISH